jgi:hypothetical protein
LQKQNLNLEKVGNLKVLPLHKVHNSKNSTKPVVNTQISFVKKSLMYFLFSQTIKLKECKFQKGPTENQSVEGSFQEWIPVIDNMSHKVCKNRKIRKN